MSYDGDEEPTNTIDDLRETVEADEESSDSDVVLAAFEIVREHMERAVRLLNTRRDTVCDAAKRELWNANDVLGDLEEAIMDLMSSLESISEEDADGDDTEDDVDEEGSEDEGDEGEDEGEDEDPSAD